MRFQIDPFPEETRRACSAIASASLPRSRGNLILTGLYLAVVIAAFMLTPGTRVMTSGIGVAAIVATAFALQADGRSRLRRAQATDPHALETHFVELSPEGLHTWCSHVDARYAWRDFAKVTENAEFYLFARASGAGVAIPKRLVQGTQEAELRTRIREWATDGGAALMHEKV